MISIIVLISCEEPPCTKDEDCSDGCPEDFNGKCLAKCVDKSCNVEMTPPAEYFMTDDKTCDTSNDCKCSKEIKGDCYPMCIKNQCNFKINPGGKREESENEFDCPKGTICVDSLTYPDSSKEMNENENVTDSLNKAKPTRKPKPTKKPKVTKKPKPTKKPGKIRTRRPEIDGRNRQIKFNPVSLKNRQMPYIKKKNKKGKWIIKKIGTGPPKKKKKNNTRRMPSPRSTKVSS